MSTKAAMNNFSIIATLFLISAILDGILCQQAPHSEEVSGSCICNPEDNNTGPVCANNGVTFLSACEFRLKQGLKADLGIRCVGECPCDDTMLGLGIDCRTSLAPASATPNLEFCGTNHVAYNSENMFMCDQVQDPHLAIACPGSCPCQLSDCPRLLPPPPNPSTTPPTLTKLLSSPTANVTQIVASSLPAVGFAQAVPSLMSKPDSPITVQHSNWRPLPAAPPSASLPSAPTQPQPVFFQQPSVKHLTQPTQPQQTWQPPPLASLGMELVQQPSWNMIQDSRPLKAFNPLAEALRSVPFRLFRHLYIAINVAAEGMKQIPMQIAKNMQNRLPPYVREIPVQLAEAVQEALMIHFDSLSRQVKDTVDAVRAILDQEDGKGNHNKV